tara:strand:- start:69 stop:737 length:669 start_codon:yes stop_codon:yes gene_type:complete
MKIEWNYSDDCFSEKNSTLSIHGVKCTWEGKTPYPKEIKDSIENFARQGVDIDDIKDLMGIVNNSTAIIYNPDDSAEYDKIMILKGKNAKSGRIFKSVSEGKMLEWKAENGITKYYSDVINYSEFIDINDLPFTGLNGIEYAKNGLCRVKTKHFKQGVRAVNFDRYGSQDGWVYGKSNSIVSFESDRVRVLGNGLTVEEDNHRLDNKGKYKEADGDFYSPRH